MGEPTRRKTDRHWDKMEALRSSLELLNRAPLMVDAYQGAVQSIMRMLGCERASVLRFGDDKQVYFVASEGLSEQYRAAVDGHCPWQQDEIDAEPIFMTDVANSDLAPELRDTILAEGIRAAAFFPMISDDGLLGKYMAYYGEPHDFTAEEISFGKILADDLVATLIRLENVEKMKRSERRLALALESVNDGLWDWNIARDEVYYSPRWEKMLGYPIGTFRTNRRAWEEIVHSDDLKMVQDMLAAHVAGDVPSYEVEYRLLAADGRWVWILDRGKVVAWTPEGRPLRAVGTHTDISRRKLAEIEKNEMQRQVEHTQRLESLGVLAGGIAHDFNNILTVILGNASMAAIEQVDNPAAVSSCLDKIVQSTQRAALLCRQMLTYSGQNPVMVEPTDLSALIREISSLLKMSIDRRVVLAYELCEPAPLVEADAAQIQQVIMNLVINASEAMDGNGGDITMVTRPVNLDAKGLSGLTVTDEVKPGNFILLEVRDSGCGMASATRARLFEPFFTNKDQGRGLGMSAGPGRGGAHPRL